MVQVSVKAADGAQVDLATLISPGNSRLPINQSYCTTNHSNRNIKYIL